MNLSSIQPRCTICNSWTRTDRCREPAIARNKFGGYECAWHHALPRNSQPDSFFKPGVLCQEIEGNTIIGRLRLQIAYFFYERFDVRIWKK